MKIRINKKSGTIRMTAETKGDGLNLLKFLETAAGRADDPNRLSLQKEKELEAEKN